MAGREPCAGLWETPVVNHNGDVTTCCLDVKMKNKLGNLGQESLVSLWRGPKIHSWRIAQILGRFDMSGPACPDCNYKSAGTYPQRKIVEYLEKTGEAKVLADYLSRQGEKTD
ncbi:MAG: hypothetical protein GXP49_15360 [Deltaproteobacteria bacterium]|nr:hypothetical protein [Deltaproteobacteria bacterium]